MRWLLKRWWFWLGTAFMLGALSTGYLLIPAGRIDRAHCDKIQLGWTHAQVDRLLGRGGLGDSPRRTGWPDEDGNWIVVDFDDGDRATGARFHPTNLSIYERVKRRIERRLRVLWPRL
jgi:hypothetical protein